MRLLFTTLLITLGSFYASAQLNIQKVYGELTYPGCERAKDKERCMTNKVAQFYLANLPREYFKPSETIDGKIYDYIHVFLVFDTKGRYTSKLITEEEDTTQMNALQRTNHKLPTMKMPQDELGYSISEGIKLRMRFELFYDNDRLINVFYRPYSRSEQKAFKEKMNTASESLVRPFFKTCVSKSVEERNVCTFNELKKFVRKKFDDRIAQRPEINESIIRINTTFTIDTKGMVKDVRADAKHEALEEEAIRVLKKLPRFTPATLDGKLIEYTISYLLSFRVLP